MNPILTCPRCGTSKYTVRANDTYRCDGCGREAASMVGWNAVHPEDQFDSPFYTDPDKRSEVPEKVPGSRAQALAEYNNRKEAAMEVVMQELEKADARRVKRELFMALLEARLLAIEKILGVAG